MAFSPLPAISSSSPSLHPMHRAAPPKHPGTHSTCLRLSCIALSAIPGKSRQVGESNDSVGTRGGTPESYIFSLARRLFPPHSFIFVIFLPPTQNRPSCPFPTHISPFDIYSSTPCIAVDRVRIVQRSYTVESIPGLDWISL